jgi:urease accessory protein
MRVPRARNPPMHANTRMDPRLLVLADGRFPAGGHAHSAGVEAAVACGDVISEATLERYLHGRLATTGVTEAAFAAASAAGGDVADLDAELTARILSPRLREVGVRMGRQLLRAGRRAFPDPALDVLDGCQQPIVLGALVAVAGGAPADAATIAMHHLGAAVTTAGVRLLGLDPLAVAAIQVASASLIVELVASADWATTAPRDLPAIGGAMTDILGEDHGHWSARLFVA